MILKDKVAIITGNTKGIGTVCAKAFVQEGVKVVGAGRTAEFGEQVMVETRAEGGEPLIDRKFIIAPGQVLKTGMMYHFEGTFARSEYKKLENGVI